ncbi:MAG: oxidoreductase [Myxococcales bacterium]|nr:oxidoreductase [Myxococcales bacterium]
MSKTEKIIQARLRLRERFLSKIKSSPSISDPEPMGSGPLNRHGMPRLPIDQFETRKWPVLDLGVHPEISKEAWRLTLDGAVQKDCTLTWADLMNLEQINNVQDFHCVTTWSRFDLNFMGVRLSTLAALAEPLPAAGYIMCHGFDGYTTNLPLSEALKDDVLLVSQVDGQPLPREHGGPVRMVVPQLYAWKGAKWIHRIEFMTEDRLGYWETRGYSNTAYPWRNDRYS